MTYTDALKAVVDGHYAQRSWWAQDYGNKIIGIHNGVLRQFRFDYWSPYDVDKYDLEATDWVVVSKAPTLDTILPRVDDLQKTLQEAKYSEAMHIVLELRHMLSRRMEEDKRAEK